MRDANRSPGPDEVVFSGVSGSIELGPNTVYIRGTLDIQGPATINNGYLRVEAGQHAAISLRNLNLTRSSVDAYRAKRIRISDSTISGAAAPA